MYSIGVSFIPQYGIDKPYKITVYIVILSKYLKIISTILIKTFIVDFYYFFSFSKNIEIRQEKYSARGTYTRVSLIFYA